MRPKLNILSDQMVEQIIAEGLELLMDPGVRVHNEEALGLLGDAGADVDMKSQIARIPEPIVRQALEKTEGNQSAAARLLGITRDQIRSRMRKFGLTSARRHRRPSA